MVWELISGAFILAVIFMLVRPNSPASAAIKDFGDALTALISTATGVHTSHNPSNPGDFANPNPPGTMNA